MCNLYSITTNQEAIRALFRVINRYVGNLPPMPGVFPDYLAPVVRNAGTDRELTMMRWGMPPPPKLGGPPVRMVPLFDRAALLIFGCLPCALLGIPFCASCIRFHPQ
jgi:putative SOS response-associated peptidase YedK